MRTSTLVRGCSSANRRNVGSSTVEVPAWTVPTRTELITYTSVVLVFVLVVMTYVSVLDLGFGKLVLWAFGGA